MFNGSYKMLLEGDRKLLEKVSVCQLCESNFECNPKVIIYFNFAKVKTVTVL